VIPNANPALFVPGKIIQVRSRENPGVVSQLVLISVEEHIGHVVTMLEWLWPNITEIQRAAARLHDIRKKLGARFEFIKGLNISVGNLRSDFYAQGNSEAALGPADAAKRYLAFAESEPRRRFWPTVDGKDFRMDLDAPFGNHAAEVDEDDLLPYRDGVLDLQKDPQSRGYVLDLIRLHHSFQPDRLIDACAQHGDELVTDLYRLIVADHAGSRWAEYVVQYLEKGSEQPDREDFFGEMTVTASAEPEPEAERNGLRVGTVRLKRERLPTESEPDIKEIVVRYYPVKVDWDLKHLAAQVRQQTGKSSVRREGSRRRRRR
jgi:hypothetical protein